MKIEKKENYSIFHTEENLFSDVLKKFNYSIKSEKKENIILHLSDNLNITFLNILEFLRISLEKKANNTSFVVIISSLNIDDLPEEINVVPTLQEAEDIIEMESIERELGF